MNKILVKALSLCLTTLAAQAQSVIFPQEQQPGEARISVVQPDAADAQAARGSLHFAGKALEAAFSYRDLDITWRAVLRDGSHYLRTELALTAKRDVAMKSVVPMTYDVRNIDGSQIPAVVGNTRGAVIASEHIFAGLETPMGINTVEGQAAISTFNYTSWTGTTFALSPGAATPQGVLDLGLGADYIDIDKALSISVPPSSVFVFNGIDEAAADGLDTLGEDHGQATPAAASASAYDLSGRRVEGQQRKGIYVSNGKKLINR